mgnify:CR=1 FL=1
MPYIKTDDDINLYYEETGSGFPIVFVHEFAGDSRSYNPQVEYFGQFYRCIVYNARGYIPSDIPPNVNSYSQARAVEDIRCILDGLGIEKSHIVGISMGGFATLHFGMTYPERAASLCIGGCGYGAEPESIDKFKLEVDTIANFILTQGMDAFADKYAHGPTRIQLENKNPIGHATFKEMLAEHSALGSANTQKGVQKERPSLYSLVEKMKKISIPTLIMTGDEDWPCLQPALLMKQNIKTAGLSILPNTGHTLNLENPAEYNQILGDFLLRVTCGRWNERDQRTISKSIMGMK